MHIAHQELFACNPILPKPTEVQGKYISVDRISSAVHLTLMILKVYLSMKINSINIRYTKCNCTSQL